MRFLALCLVLALAACSPAPAPPPPEASRVPAPPPPVQSPAPEPSLPPPSPVTLQVDASDFVEWGEGGGIDGRWKGTRVFGDGRVVRNENQEETESRIEPARAAVLLQAAADAGLLELKDHPTQGADMLGRGIQAELDGRKVSVSMDEMTQDPAWERVWAVLKLP